MPNNDTEDLFIDSKVFKKYLSSHKIHKIVIEISKELNEYYADKTPVIIGITNGCIYFMMDLLRKINFKYEINFINASSYRGTKSMVLTVDKINSIDFKGRNILVVEDIIDSGKTMNKIYEDILRCNPKDIKVITLLNKNTKHRNLKFKINWIGFNIPDKYVIGYGMDYNNLFRYLKDIYIENE